MKKNLDEKDLDNVTGGNYGDEDMEFSETPEGVRFLYNIGDHVEVFKGDIVHNHTDGATVIDRKTSKTSSGCTSGYVGYYQVKYDGQREITGWVTADRIERK